MAGNVSLVIMVKTKSHREKIVKIIDVVSSTPSTNFFGSYSHIIIIIYLTNYNFQV